MFDIKVLSGAGIVSISHPKEAQQTKDLLYTINNLSVLGLARTGLIFTGHQEGAQPGGGGDPTWANRARYSISCDVTLGSGVGGGATRRELSHGLGGRGAGPVRESGCLGRTVRCCVFLLFVHLLFLFPSVCCSVKLPLSRPTGFCLFLFILLRTPAGGGAAAWCFCCRQQQKPKHWDWSLAKPENLRRFIIPEVDEKQRAIIHTTRVVLCDQGENV